MTWLEIQTLKQAVKAYALVAIIAGSLGFYNGCNSGYERGYKDGLYERRIGGLEKKVEKYR